MTPVFVDSGYIIALENQDDQNHARAMKHWQEMVASVPIAWVTTSYVLDEVATYFNNSNQHRKAVEVGRRLMESPSIRFVHVDAGLFGEAWNYFERHTDKNYSLTDCVSFVLMARLGIKTALTFDHHFVQAGFQQVPGPALMR